MKKWDEMTARERDALVAEKVMGWRVQEEADYWLTSNGEVRTWDVTSFGAFKPSTDISAAWEVFEELRSKGRYLDICTFADFYEIFDGEESLAELPSLPEAICLAALRAVGCKCNGRHSNG